MKEASKCYFIPLCSVLIPTLQPAGGGGFSLVDDIRGCLKAYGCFFVTIGISIGGFLSQTQCAQFANLGVFWKIWPKKHLIFSKLCVFVAIWYRNGSQNHASRGKEVVEILKSTLSIHVQIFLKTPPPALQNHEILRFIFIKWLGVTLLDRFKEIHTTMKQQPTDWCVRTITQLGYQFATRM